jgi:hypothetical protein
VCSKEAVASAYPVDNLPLRTGNVDHHCPRVVLESGVDNIDGDIRRDGNDNEFWSGTQPIERLPCSIVDGEG